MRSFAFVNSKNCFWRLKIFSVFSTLHCLVKKSYLKKNSNDSFQWLMKEIITWFSWFNVGLYIHDPICSKVVGHIVPPPSTATHGFLLHRTREYDFWLKYSCLFKSAFLKRKKNPFWCENKHNCWPVVESTNWKSKHVFSWIFPCL